MTINNDHYSPDIFSGNTGKSWIDFTISKDNNNGLEGGTRRNFDQYFTQMRA